MAFAPVSCQKTRLARQESMSRRSPHTPIPLCFAISVCLSFGKNRAAAVHYFLTETGRQSPKYFVLLPHRQAAAFAGVARAYGTMPGSACATFCHFEACGLLQTGLSACIFQILSLSLQRDRDARGIQVCAGHAKAICLWREKGTYVLTGP